MARHKSNNTIISISFENEVLEALEEKCRKIKAQRSTFVNALIKRFVMSEYEFYRQLSKFHASELHKYKTLMNTSLDKPEGE